MDLFNKLESIVQCIYTSSQESNSIVCKYCINRDTSNVSFAETLVIREGKPLGSQTRIGEGCSFHSFRTNNYKLHFFESPSGVKVGMSCSSDVPLRGSCCRHP